MRERNWKLLVGITAGTAENGPELIIADWEARVLHMFRGIGVLTLERIPEAFRWLLRRLRDAVRFTLRIAIRLVRLAVVLAAYLATVFGPLALFPGIVSLAWTGFALAGSWLGLQRHLRKRAKAATAATSSVVLVRT